MHKSLIGAILAATAFAAQTFSIDDEDDFDFVNLSDSNNGPTLVLLNTPSRTLDECFDDCAECGYAYYSDDPTFEFAICMNWGVYRYSNPCQ